MFAFVVAAVIEPELFKVDRVVLLLSTLIAKTSSNPAEAEIVPALVTVNVLPLSKSTATFPDPWSIVVPDELSTFWSATSAFTAGIIPEEINANVTAVWIFFFIVVSNFILLWNCLISLYNKGSV